MSDVRVEDNLLEGRKLGSLKLEFMCAFFPLSEYEKRTDRNVGRSEWVISKGQC